MLVVGEPTKEIQRRWGVQVSILPFSNLFSYATGPSSAGKLAITNSDITNCVRDAGLDVLPNDLTRILYLASLRDCNSGSYFHPQLSIRNGTEGADRALRACHDQFFGRLLTAPASGFVRQLEEYIRYNGIEPSAVVKTWQALQAYRAAVPVRTLPIYSELFCLNIELALIILGAGSATQAGTQEAASRSA
ncbi:MAG: hypothetical protein DMG79_19515 [Acidobacteria bacterium]|nr:MAG: hypothetical protein DMG79_19515 [Acidobacteriota bacterium]